MKRPTVYMSVFGLCRAYLRFFLRMGKIYCGGPMLRG